VGRRMQLLGEFATEKGYVALVDDYGHHPREIEATLEALRDVWPDRRIVMVFQPHRYTRTESLWSDFVQVLAKPDKLLLLDIYSAGEQAAEGINSERLCANISDSTAVAPRYISDVNQVQDVIFEEMQDGDVLLLQGAGNIGKIAADLAQTKMSTEVTR
ncbi:MAG: UDP-N-acetylmuramate--L-alanine ligase, partial [Coxiellaceae bacterium]|nr:UDP-N-acetylmuramate--L-alanine ligase [Coxiellaceae bacterium]